MCLSCLLQLMSILKLTRRSGKDATWLRCKQVSHCWFFYFCSRDCLTESKTFIAILYWAITPRNAQLKKFWLRIYRSFFNTFLQIMYSFAVFTIYGIYSVKMCFILTTLCMHDILSAHMQNAKPHVFSTRYRITIFCIRKYKLVWSQFQNEACPKHKNTNASI